MSDYPPYVQRLLDERRRELEERREARRRQTITIAFSIDAGPALRALAAAREALTAADHAILEP